MRTRTRTDSPVEQRLDLSWDTPSADTPPVEHASTDESRKPLDDATTSSEPVSPPPTKETSPASSNGTENTLLESPASVAEPANPETPEATSPTDKQAPTATIAEEPAASTQETPQANSPSPALPSDEASQSPSPVAVDASQEPSATAAADNPANAQDTLPEGTPSKPMDNPSRIPRKPAPPVNIIPKDEPVGVVLARKREEANVKIEDLAKRLNINEFVIRYLESGDYEGLERTFGENNCVYIVFNFKSIGEELGMSKNEIDDLVEKLNKEIKAAGLKLDAPVKHDEANNFDTLPRRRPVKSVLPKLLVFTLLFICIIITVLAVVVPYVNNIRQEPQKRVDFLPLIEQPWKSMRTIPPQQLPIP